MAWFNFGKKKEKIETATEVVKETSETSACLGMFDFFTLGKSNQVLILGRWKLKVRRPSASMQSWRKL